MKKWLALLVLALALGLVVAGCGDDEEDTGGGGGGATEVSIGDNFFEPQEASVTPGATVKWTNDGQVAHTVTKTGGPGEQFDSGSIEPGGDFETEVSETGTIEYVCTIHP